MIGDLDASKDYDALLKRSHTVPVFLLKHSTRCPISSAAWRAYQMYAAAHPDLDCYRVLVVERRDLSREIARETGVSHQSPQVMLFKAGEVTWHASHYSITVDALEGAMTEATAQ
jgi:bacillithiol system protein YtxJ